MALKVGIGTLRAARVGAAAGATATAATTTTALAVGAAFTGLTLRRLGTGEGRFAGLGRGADPEARVEARDRLDAYLAAATTAPTVGLGE
jgi:hypothetical protein